MTAPGHPVPGRPRAVLFDLDGTLADTAPDLGHALNEMRRRRGLESLPYSVLRPQASHGTRGMIMAGFGIGPEHGGFAAMRQEFLDIYASCLTARTILFPGVEDMLDALEGRCIPWGVVTNKPARYTGPLLDYLGLLERAACVVSGDTCPRPKPHPESLLHACRAIQVLPGECIYVGDAARDAEAAHAAGMPALIAMYGYIGVDDRPGDWGAKGFLRQPVDLLEYLVAS